jgi:hypothetical protein
MGSVPAGETRQVLLYTLDKVLNEYKNKGGTGCPFCGAEAMMLAPPLHTTDEKLLIIPEHCDRCGAAWNNHFKWDHSSVVEQGRPMEPRKARKPVSILSMPRRHRALDEEIKKTGLKAEPMPITIADGTQPLKRGT